MKIELTDEQYKTLIEMVYLGEWMINACRHPDEVIKKYQDLEQHLYSFAKAGGMERYVEYDEESKQFYPSQEFELRSDVEKYRAEFEDETFWDELIERMSVRDTVRKIGEKVADEMNGLDFYEKQIPFLEKYNKEFEENGLENLEIADERKR